MRYARRPAQRGGVLLYMNGLDVFASHPELWDDGVDQMPGSLTLALALALSLSLTLTLTFTLTLTLALTLTLTQPQALTRTLTV